MIGQTISHYTILEKLGEGGMGVVYKAEDTRLKRTVALKLLPEQATSTEDDKQRFLQEAQAASALNHPNVCHINSVGEHQGKHFIDMEFVDGMTLRKKIAAAGPGAGLKLEEAIEYAIQIGDALHEAHSKGIVHRDIKAENIMLNSRNQVKVMDFGLAKIKGAMRLTKSSSTIGTLAYMAPEQLQGSGNDARSDIFSFGVVLYEMLTGRTPFRGEHEAAMMYSIMNEEPEPIDKFLPNASSELLHIVNRVLEKNPDDRYQHAQDMVIDLRRLRKDSTKVHRRPTGTVSGVYPGDAQGGEGRPGSGPVPGTGTGTDSGVITGAGSGSPSGTIGGSGSDAGHPATGMPGSGVHTAATSKKPLWIGVGVLVVAAIVAGVFLFSKKSARELNPEMTTRVLQVPFTQISYPGLSPDGKWVAFPAADANGKWDIYYMHSGEAEARRITFDSSAFGQQVADISPDGSRIIYNRQNLETGRHELFVVSSLGGGSKRIADGGNIGRWRPDGRRVGYMKGPGGEAPSKSNKFEFWSVGADGSDERLEFTDTIGVTANSRFSFCWSADGASVGWLRTNDRLFQSIIIHDLASGEERLLTGGEENMDDISWTASDEVIYSSNKSGNTNLWTIPAAGGTPSQITKGSGPDIGMKVSADGRSLVYLQQQRIGNIWIGSFLDGSSRQLTFDERQIGSPDFSPDGRKIAFQMTDPDPLKLGSGIYVMDRNGGERRRITPEREFAQNPKWSPDGKWIAYQAIDRTDTGQTVRIQVIDASNPGTPKNLGRGNLWGWLNARIVLLQNNEKFVKVYVAAVDDTLRKQFFADSMAGAPLLGGKYFVYTPAMPQPKSPREGTPTTLRPGNTALQRVERGGLGGGAVDGNDNDAVGDDEVHMGCGRNFAQRIAIEADAGDADDIELAARGIGCALEGRGDGIERCRVRIIGARRRLADDAARRHEAGDIVDVPVGVIVLQAFVDPDDLARAERLAKCGFGDLLGPAVAVGIEQRLARRQDRALAVMIDGAAFEHEVEAADGLARKARDVVADRRVVGKIVFAAPAVGREAKSGEAVGRHRKDRSRVAQPDIAVLRGNELGGLADGRACRSLGLGAVDQQAHLVALSPVAFSERAHERRHVAARRLEITVPFVRIGRPCRPDRLLRRPLRRHGNHRFSVTETSTILRPISRATRSALGGSPSIDERACKADDTWASARPCRGRQIGTYMRPAATRQVVRTPQPVFLTEQRDASVSVQMGRCCPYGDEPKPSALTISDRGTDT